MMMSKLNISRFFYCIIFIRFDKNFLRNIRKSEEQMIKQKQIVNQRINKKVMDEWLLACRDFKILNSSLENNLRS